VQSLHDDDDGTVLLVVLPAIEGVIVPIVGGSSLRFGERLFGFERVIDNDDIGAAPGQRATVRAGNSVPLVGGDELLHGLAVWRQAGWKDPPIPLAHHDAAAVAGELVGEILGIADAEELGRRILPEIPRRKGDRGQQGFERAGRQIDDQPTAFALAHCYQLGGDDLDMPIRRKLGLRVQIVKAARREGLEVLPQQSVVLGPIQSLDHSLTGLARRALSCSITFSSASVKGTVSDDAGGFWSSLSRRASSREPSGA